MFKLIKWTVYVSIAYFLYKFVADVTTDRRPTNAGRGIATPQGRQNSRRPANMTGSTGQGAFVPVADSGGAQRRAKVGRGVIS
jgi:hypothetical protein